jgi:chemotaxis protein MotB
MKSQSLFSDQRETPRTAILKADSVEEDTFLWSLADLLTLLLIFFIFLYAQSSGQIVSGASTSQFSTAATPIPPVHLASTTPAQMESAVFKPVSTRPNVVPTLTDTYPPEGTNTTPIISHAPAVPEPPQEPQKMDISEGSSSEGSMEYLRQAALSAIHKTEESACSIRWNQNRLVFVLGERLTFPVGEARLLTDFEPTLKQIARLIAAKKEYRVMVSGHTDDTPIATDEFPSNWELSAARAITVAKSIIRNGVDPRRITIQGYGEFRPLHENSSPENKEANRRVEIALFKEKDREQDSEPLY